MTNLVEDSRATSMTGKEIAIETKSSALAANDHDDLKGTLRNLGGSRSDVWNTIIADQTVQALWLKQSDPGTRNKQLDATFAALIGIGPKDELEGMMASQLIAAHNAAMECYRRAKIPEQSFEGRQENLAQTNKLSRTYATLLEALNRHRGKGQQTVSVEHVHVHAGGQAVVGVMETPGGGDRGKLKDQPDARQITHAPQLAMRRPNTEREPMPVAGDAERPVPDAWGASPGAPKGNRNAFKHGRYTAEAIARRQEVAALVRSMRALAANS
jgi:hypothetical protein